MRLLLYIFIAAVVVLILWVIWLIARRTGPGATVLAAQPVTAAAPDLRDENIQAAQLPTKGNSGFREVSDAVLDTFHKWADESDAFAADLDEPTFSFQLMKRITPDANGTVFYMSMDHFFDDRLKRLVDLDDAAHRADRG